ncbi:MAG: type II toxin-antitoxin system PemK/MazF family toxin [Desulfovibrionaceae bacterium]
MVTCPQQGHLVWIEFGPTIGHEQDGKRPGLVVSDEIYNQKGLFLVVPITSRRKGYPFEVVLPEGLAVEGVVLADQVRCLDWKSRNARVAGVVPKQTLDEVVAKLLAIIRG